MSLVRQIVLFEEQRHNPSDGSRDGGTAWYGLQCDSPWLNYTGTPYQSASDVNGIWPNLGASAAVFAVALAVFILLKKKMFNKAPEAQPTSARPASGSAQNRRRQNIETAVFGNQSGRRQPPEDTAEKRTRIWYRQLRDAISESDYDLLTRGGVAALEYIRFQRYVLIFTVMVCAMSLCVLLPVNLGGMLFTNTMGRISLTNLPPDSSRLWFHVLLTMVLFPLGIAAMRQFGLQLPPGSQTTLEHNSRTVMFSGLPSRRANPEMIRNHFRQAYPHYQVDNVSLTYDISRLAKLEEQVQLAEDAARYCSEIPAGDDRIKIRVGNNFCCCCCGPKVDAEKYYSLRNSQLNQEIEAEFQKWRRINPVFFVTFGNSSQAYQAYEDHQRCAWCNGRQRPTSHHAKDLNSNNWVAFSAPDPSNVHWENLSQSGWLWYLKALIINLLLLGIIAGLATAIVVLNFSSLPQIRKLSNYPGLSQVLPALLMLLLQKMVPELIVHSVNWIGYWSRPKQLIAEMRYIFGDLILAIVLIPSTGLIAATAAFLLGNAPTPIRRACISLPDDGSLYIHYLIFYAFISTAMSLFRVKVLIRYLVRSCRARSKAEEVVASRVDIPFSFGEEYASFLTAFTVTIVYSFINPLISLLGVIALLMKYLLDQYLLCHVYKRSVVPTSVHSVAVNQFLSAVVLQVVAMLMIFLLRNGLDGYVLLLGLSLIVYGSILVSIVFFQIFEKVSVYQLLNQGAEEPLDGTLELGNTSYVPGVLLRQQRRLSPPDYSAT